MGGKDKNNYTTYNKLVRDRIPEIIKNHGNMPFVRRIEGDELQKAIGEKIIEEAFELFTEWQRGCKDNILNESADILEIVLTALKQHGLNLDDLIERAKERYEKRGGFNDQICLDQVGGVQVYDFFFQKFPALVLNPAQSRKLINIIKGELKRSTAAWIASAFYSPGATNLLVSELSQFTKDGGKLKILLSTMGNITRPEYFIHIKDHVLGAEVKAFHPPDIPFDQSPPNFHVKAWLFLHHDGQGSMITGSSNFTEGGLAKNFEWNYFSAGEINLPFENGISPFESAITEYEEIWTNKAAVIDDAFILGYRQRFQPIGWTMPNSLKTEIFETTLGRNVQTEKILPNEAQREAIENLLRLRSQGVTKAAVIAATGIGKTHLAAFDYKQGGFSSLLFIAHREDILVKAREIFRAVMNDPSFGYIYGRGQVAPYDCQAVFGMIQTISRSEHLEKLLSGNFDYIVIDEFHHSHANSYRKVLDHLKADFLLGLTATPERMDGRNVLAYCNYNVAYEVRVLDAVNRGWLVPFQYYAIYDESDYTQIAWRGTRYDEEELDSVLKNDTRTAIIARNLKKYLPSTGKIKSLAFCSSISHARYTAEKLSNEYNIPAIALWGDSPDHIRHEALDRLQQETDTLNVICTVDLFNEGTDIPSITHILFLRPTQSFTLFLQQLGRGLRKSENKDFLVVIDFIGNFRNAYIAPIALCGYTSLEHFISGNQKNFKKDLEERLPDGCYLSPDMDVQRIWDDEIRKFFLSNLPLTERLKIIYQDIKRDLGQEQPLNLMDMVSNAYDIDPHLYLKKSTFGNWLRAKQFCEDGNLPAAEALLIDTPGEYLLQYIETGLSPVKSYKMVVLLSLLKLNGTKWPIEDIAREFLAYYLNHPDQLSDYEALAKSDNPASYRLSLVSSHLKSMPLDKLSNLDSDCFVLDKANRFFRLKPEYETFWLDPAYKLLIKDRTEFVLYYYFKRGRLQHI